MVSISVIIKKRLASACIEERWGHETFSPALKAVIFSVCDVFFFSFELSPFLIYFSLKAVHAVQFGETCWCDTIHLETISHYV